MRCISSGPVSDESVNVDTAKEIAESILKSMENKCVEDFTFKSQAVALNCKIQVKINNDSVAVDQQLLFQRLISYSVL